MAEIVATFNTVDKTLVVTQDGKVLDNVERASFGCSYDDPDEFCCSISMCESDDENSMKMYHQMSASKAQDNPVLAVLLNQQAKRLGK